MSVLSFWVLWLATVVTAYNTHGPSAAAILLLACIDALTLPISQLVMHCILALLSYQKHGSHVYSGRDKLSWYCSSPCSRNHPLTHTCMSMVHGYVESMPLWIALQGMPMITSTKLRQQSKQSMPCSLPFTYRVLDSAAQLYGTRTGGWFSHFTAYLLSYLDLLWIHDAIVRWCCIICN